MSFIVPPLPLPLPPFLFGYASEDKEYLIPIKALYNALQSFISRDPSGIIIDYVLPSKYGQENYKLCINQINNLGHFINTRSTDYHTLIDSLEFMTESDMTIDDKYSIDPKLLFKFGHKFLYQMELKRAEPLVSNEMKKIPNYWSSRNKWRKAYALNCLHYNLNKTKKMKLTMSFHDYIIRSVNRRRLFQQKPGHPPPCKYESFMWRHPWFELDVIDLFKDIPLRLNYRS